jgi:hypothetical protein
MLTNDFGEVEKLIGDKSMPNERLTTRYFCMIRRDVTARVGATGQSSQCRAESKPRRT